MRPKDHLANTRHEHFIKNKHWNKPILIQSLSHDLNDLKSECEFVK